MKKLSILMVFTLSLMTWIPVKAQDQKAKTELLTRFEQMLAESQWKVVTLNGGPKAQWLLRQRRLDRLIDQLKAGQSVDPKEIDQLLKEGSR